MTDKDTNAPGKPRLAEVLGVEVGEKWRVVLPEENINSVEMWLNEKGYLLSESMLHPSVLCTAINHPESIIRAPRLTDPEIAIMRAVGAKWVSMDTKSLTGLKADLWDVEPHKTPNGVYVSQNADPIARVKIELFPSVKPGECIKLEEEK